MRQRRNTFQFLNKQTDTDNITDDIEVVEEQEEKEGHDYIVIEDDDQYTPVSTTTTTTRSQPQPQPAPPTNQSKNVVKDLKKICEEMNIYSVTNGKKDEIVQGIIKRQTDVRALKQQMFVSNPLVNYSKYTFDYTLPWSIICKILDQVWYDSSVCTCYYSDYLLKKRKEIINIGKGHFYEWEVELSFVHKQARSQCPMHTFHYANNIIPSIAIDNPLKKYVCNQNLWRYQLLLVSKRINQFISYNYFTKLKCPFMYTSRSSSSEIWHHINNPYCPFKKPKSLTLRNGIVGIDACVEHVSHSMFDTLEKLKLDRFCLPQRHGNYYIRYFKGIKSLTLIEGNFHMVPLLEVLKSCTSLNMAYQKDDTETRGYINHLPVGAVVKLLLPPTNTINPTLPTNFNPSTIQITNIHKRLDEMTNLHTLHLTSWHESFPLNLPPSVTTLVVYPTLVTLNNPEFQLPTNITTLKICLSKLKYELPLYDLDSPELIEYTRFGINTLLITYKNEITENQINQFKRKGYEYHGSTFKPSDLHKRQLRFIKTNITPEIEYYTPLPTQQPNNPTLPFYIIAKIVKYSWNSYWCNCHQIQGGPFKWSSLKHIEKPPCHVHSWHKNEGELLATINRLRFGLTLVCKKLFVLVSQHLLTKIGFIGNNNNNISSIHANPYCVMAKSIQHLSILTDSMIILPQEMYSQVKILKIVVAQRQPNPLLVPDFHFLLGLGSLTSLDINKASSDLFRILKDLPLKKLYTLGITLPFGKWNDDNILSQSLEAVSINKLDELPMLTIFPNLRHLRFATLNSNDKRQPITLPTRVVKISFDDPSGAFIAKCNPQVTRLTLLYPWNNNDNYLSFLTMKCENVEMITIHSRYDTTHSPQPQSSDHAFSQIYLLQKQIIRYTMGSTVYFKWTYLSKQLILAKNKVD
ncbi:hypothetical protein DFA_00777 [Cavenderia fasciculata]|uniref:Uncharacterized protein n=1 Tax=Cavenderia fasciculata TaxID=261658 RepID=F4PTT1_CACFS|nr:uncharacterized protein DFA_00777 [Cavenderia fasciculata]EGG20910.1 hypothetical protein DFA_00777 [Cavenderia fasciculata]|eukprot:XP_004358760.1 hypothetical protein DFA_00777 [Cavenderia fasciculata]